MHDSDPTPHQDPEDRDRPEAADDPAPGARAEFGDAPRADGPEHDIDAEFAAMVEGLALPGEMQADLESVDEAGPSIISVDDVPHNTYTAPREPLTGGRGGTDRDSADRDPADEDADGLVPGRAAEEEPQEKPDSGAPGSPRAVKVAVVLTPLASAEALAALCAMSELDCTVVPARSGAFAVKEFVSAHVEWDVSELLGGAETEPAEAAELASTLSRLSRAGVVLLTADLATDVGIESGLSGTITARRYTNGDAGEDAAAGLLLASVDQEVEDVLLGATRADDIRGAVKSSEVKPSKAMRWFTRGLRRPRGKR